MSNNFLSPEKQALAVSMLCEGMGIRPTARVLGCHRDTIMRLGRDVGEGYARYHDEYVINLAPNQIELDEAWSFVFKKQARIEPGDSIYEPAVGVKQNVVLSCRAVRSGGRAMHSRPPPLTC